MKKIALLAIVLLVVGALFVPVVSADICYDEEIVDYLDTSSKTEEIFTGSSRTVAQRYLVFTDISDYQSLSYIIVDYNGDYQPDIPLGRQEFEYVFNGKTRPGVVYKSVTTNLLGIITNTRLTIFLNDWDIGSLSGKQWIELPFMSTSRLPATNLVYPSDPAPHKVYLAGLDEGIPKAGLRAHYTVASATVWKNHILIENTTAPEGYEITLDRSIDGKVYTSTLNISKDDIVVNTNYATGTEFNTWYPTEDIDKVDVISPYNTIYTYMLGSASDEPPDALHRIGTVTMTDHNGTTITGFEVTAVNAYTGQSYTVSTDTDVAVLSLPMDRTTEIRNPQTGEYEETAIGYYRFYGQKAGYKMLLEEGIQVAVMPEKYSSYQLCDILVTSESGYLTGQHKFQIRSRADNSVLQTGTISAKSATTGDWYNTSVSGGIASLILPYDTSNPISQYAGNYYVYATSPGYIDSEYATQIVVMPHTVSEIHDIYLTPIGGIPTSGNVTLRIQVFSETGPGIVNAKIFIAGVIGEGVSVWDTYTTSSTGYLEVSVPANSTYDIVASAGGYYDSAHRIEVYTENPALIEMKLYFSGAPTVEPTTQPTGWQTVTPTPTPRPTEVAPGNSPIDNFILMFVNMGFDSGMALWLTGLFLICVAAVIGHLIAGKFGAILAAPIGIVMTTGLGLIPFWGMVILLVIAALVIAKMVMR